MLIVALIAFSALGLMPMLFDSLPAIIASRVVVGLAEASILTVGNALMGDYFEGAERQRWLGYQNMVGPIFGSTTLLVKRTPSLVVMVVVAQLFTVDGMSAGCAGSDSIVTRGMNAVRSARPIAARRNVARVRS